MPEPERVEEPASVEGDLGGDYDASGIDRTQIRAMLALSPEERLDRLQSFAESVLAIRAENR